MIKSILIAPVALVLAAAGVSSLTTHHTAYPIGYPAPPQFPVAPSAAQPAVTATEGHDWAAAKWTGNAAPYQQAE